MSRLINFWTEGLIFIFMVFGRHFIALKFTFTIALFMPLITVMGRVCWASKYVPRASLHLEASFWIKQLNCCSAWALDVSDWSINLCKIYLFSVVAMEWDIVCVELRPLTAHFPFRRSYNSEYAAAMKWYRHEKTEGLGESAISPPQIEHALAVNPDEVRLVSSCLFQGNLSIEASK